MLVLETSRRARTGGGGGGDAALAKAAYVNGSGTATLLFRYVSEDGDYTADLDYRSPASFQVCARASAIAGLLAG